jgi:hypothetical protein
MTKIYIRLLDEGTDVFRPTDAEPVGSQFFQVLPTSNYDEEDEVWEFAPGSVVECEQRQLGGEEVLVAIKRTTVPGVYTP